MKEFCMMDRSEQSSRLWDNQGTKEEKGEFQYGILAKQALFLRPHLAH